MRALQAVVRRQLAQINQQFTQDAIDRVNATRKQLLQQLTEQQDHPQSTAILKLNAELEQLLSNSSAQFEVLSTIFHQARDEHISQLANTLATTSTIITLALRHMQYTIAQLRYQTPRALQGSDIEQSLAALCDNLKALEQRYNVYSDDKLIAHANPRGSNITAVSLKGNANTLLTAFESLATYLRDHFGYDHDKYQKLNQQYHNTIKGLCLALYTTDDKQLDQHIKTVKTTTASIAEVATVSRNGDGRLTATAQQLHDTFSELTGLHTLLCAALHGYNKLHAAYRSIFDASSDSDNDSPPTPPPRRKQSQADNPARLTAEAPTERQKQNNEATTAPKSLGIRVCQ